MKKLLMVILLLTLSLSANDSKVFVREYTYNAGDDDSKNSSRKEALKQLKSLLSEEVGVHIESSLNITDTVKNGVSKSYVTSEINSLSASITKLTVLDEKWNGITYYVKASVKIDEEQTMTLLLEAIKSKASEKDVKRLNKILAEQNGNLDKSYNKIQALQKKLVLQEIKNQASKNELADTNKKLKQLKQDIAKYNKDIISSKALEKEYKTELAKRKALVKKLNLSVGNQAEKDLKKWNLTRSILCQVEKGVTYDEMFEATGIKLKEGDTKGQNSYYNTHICPSDLLHSKGVRCLEFKFKRKRYPDYKYTYLERKPLCIGKEIKLKSSHSSSLRPPKNNNKYIPIKPVSR